MSTAPTPVPEGNKFAFTKELTTLFWPTAVALLAGFAHFLGYMVERGKSNALGLDALAAPTISQEYIFTGAIALIAILGPAVVIAAVWVLAAKGLRSLSRRHWGQVLGERLDAFFHGSAVWWFGLIAAIAGAFGLNWIMYDLVRQADGMILKAPADVGGTWMTMVLDPEVDSFNVYWSLLCGGLTSFVGLGVWLMRSGFTTQRRRRLFGCWLSLQVLTMISALAMILGAASTIRKYPVVSFSNAEQLLGKDAVPLLIGSDDKQFAFLVVFSKATANRIVAYVPRSELKWLAIVNNAPLHLYAHVHELEDSQSSVPKEPKAPITGPSLPPK